MFIKNEHEKKLNFQIENTLKEFENAWKYKDSIKKPNL